MIKNLLVFLIALALIQCSSASQSDLQARVIRSVNAVPAIVRLVAPSTDSTVLAVIDESVAAFNEFQSNPDISNWRKAIDIWNNRAKFRLLNLNNQRISGIVAAIDIVIAQVIVPELPARTSKSSSVVVARSESSGTIKTKFREEDVKELERLVKSNQ